MAIYQRGNNWYIDFRSKGQRVRESIGPSRKDAEKIIAKKKTEIIENKYLTKNGECRDIPINETVRATLKAMEQRGSLVFSNRNGNRIDNCALYLAFYGALKKSKIEDFKFHDLRHSFASSLVMAGVELNDVRELLGHKKMEMTLRYAHLSPKHKTKVVNILDRGMAQNPPQAEKVVQLRP